LDTVAAAAAIPSADPSEDEFALLYVLRTLHEAVPLELAAIVSSFGLPFALQSVSKPWVTTREAGVSYIGAIEDAVADTDESLLSASAVSLASENLRLACADGLTCDDVIDAVRGDARRANDWTRHLIGFMLPHEPTQRAVGVLTSGLKRFLVLEGTWPAASVDECCNSLGMLPYHALRCWNRRRMKPPSSEWWRLNGRRSLVSSIYAADAVMALSHTFQRGISVDVVFDLFGPYALNLLAMLNRDGIESAPRLLAAPGLSLAATWSMVREGCESECDAVAAMSLICELCYDMHRRYPLRDAMATLETSKMLRDARDDLNVFRLILPSERQYLTLSDTDRLCKSAHRRRCLINFLLRTTGRLAGRASVDRVKRSIEFVDRGAKRSHKM
jgi:hypothetical protein